MLRNGLLRQIIESNQIFISSAGALVDFQGFEN